METGFRRERKKPMAEMNVVPYIDVMLVLLVIFMITAPMLTQGLQVELPKATTDTMTLKEQQPVVVSIKRDGSYWIRVGEEKDRRASADAIAYEVKEAIADHPETAVLVNGDQRVDYGVVVKLMANLQQAGIRNVGLLTEPGQ